MGGNPVSGVLAMCGVMMRGSRDSLVQTAGADDRGAAQACEGEAQGVLRHRTGVDALPHVHT
jgi:hypothetical protein